MSPLSINRCVSVSVVVCIYNQIEKVDRMSPLSLKGCLSVSVEDLALCGSATNGALSIE